METLKLDSFNTIYNARHLRPEEVAESFIYTPDYEELIQGNHTVLLGARGCGKTTLMKMLTLPALHSWKGKNATKIRNNIKFYSIYISTDIYWNVQKSSYYNQLLNFPGFADVISKVAVTTNVLYALCEAFKDIIKLELNSPKNEEKEIQLSKELITLWLLPPTIPNLDLIQEGLLKRTEELNRFIQKTVFNSSSVQIDQEEYFLDFDKLVPLTVKIFERIFDITNNPKWALCFDELELAPSWLQDNLFGSLRSRDQKILYKLSASPILSISKDLIATPGNDLKLIKMWPHSHGNSEGKYLDFSEKLVKSILKKRFNVSVDPERVFGSNPLLSKIHKVKDYEEGGRTWKEIKKLADEDKALSELLIKHGIDPSNPIVNEGNKGKLDTVLRKIKPIVYFRNYYSSIDKLSESRNARSRKASTLFYGKEVLYKISDGNPRWLIGIVNQILSRYVKDSVTQVSPANQAIVLREIGLQFHNVIKTIPDALVELKSQTLTLSGILKETGEGFFKEIVLDDFQRDPHNTFTIDSGISEGLLKVLSKAVYQGAIVLVNPTENAFDFEMRGKRFRLSYLFCPIYKIPLRLYAEKPLSKCLTGKETIINQIEISYP